MFKGLTPNRPPIRLAGNFSSLRLKALAITDHVPHRGNFDPRRMQWEEFAPFNDELDRMKEKYEGQIHLIKGFECEYYPFALEDYRTFREKYGGRAFAWRGPGPLRRNLELKRE